MAQRQTFQIGSGLFILLGFAALAYLATQTTSIANYSQGPSYAIKARFTNVGQLKLRAPVKVAGVRIGTVSDVKLQPGGSPDVFKDGDEVVLTQSSMQLEELIGKYLVGGDAAKKADAKPEEKP